MNREYQYAESTSPTSGTALYEQKVNLSFTGTQGDQWFVIGTQAINHDLVGSYQAGVLDDNNASIALFQNDIIPKDAADYHSCPVLGLTPALGSGANNFNHTLYLAQSGSNSYIIREASLLAIKKINGDLFAGATVNESPTGGSTTNTAGYDAIATLTVPAGTATQNYLVLSGCAATKDTTASNYNIRMTINGTPYSDATMRAVTAGNQQPFFDHAVVSLAAGDTVSIEAKSSTSGTVTLDYTTIIAFPLDTFPWYKSTASRSAVTTTSTTYREVPTDDTPIISDLIQNKPLWVLSSCLGTRGGATVTHYQRTMWDTTQLQESNNEPPVASGENCHMAQTVVTPSAGYHEAYTALKSDGVGITTATKSEAIVTMVQLSDNATVRVLGKTNVLGATNVL